MTTDNYAKDCELVLALVAPVGVNLEQVQEKLKSYIAQFKYTVNLIHLSRLAQAEVGDKKVCSSEAERIHHGMNIGNKLRESRGDYLALIAISEILSKRSNSSPMKRTVHLVRSLKHPDEAETLRQVYGPGFFQLGVSSSIESRRDYLQNEKGVKEEELEGLIQRDDNEGKKRGQRTKDVFELSDAFLVADDAGQLSTQVGRILNLLFGDPYISPSQEEYAMFLAYSASLRSADLSRQVGAVVATRDGDIVSAGANDVPKFGGGLYWPTDEDQRDYIKKCDSNEKRRNEIVVNVMRKVRGDETTPDEDLVSEGKKLLKDTGILDITEYGRAVHAEMEAILSCARSGISVKDATLFTTTYPCHNCAKHIVAAGMKRVVFIEPYPKSLATVLHEDSIELNDGKKGRGKTKNKVVFEPFFGVGPRKFVDLFSIGLSSGRKIRRKLNGRTVEWARATAELRVPMSPLSYLDNEMKIIAEYNSLKVSH